MSDTIHQPSCMSIASSMMKPARKKCYVAVTQSSEKMWAGVGRTHWRATVSRVYCLMTRTDSEQIEQLHFKASEMVYVYLKGILVDCNRTVGLLQRTSGACTKHVFVQYAKQSCPVEAHMYVRILIPLGSEVY